LDQPVKIDFVGIGPPKSGTTWLGHILAAHPQICMSEPKEVNFFNDSLSFNRSYNHRNFHRGLSWYTKHFRHCKEGQVKGEVTPRYILDPVVPQRLYEHNPDVKIIVTLRNPFDRIISHYHSAKDFHHSEKRSFSVAIREEPEYIYACLYYKNLQPFLSYFDLKQIFFVDLDEVKTDAENVLRGLYAFLGVDPDFKPSFSEKKSNPARATHSVWLRKLTGSVHRTMVALGFSSVILFLKRLGLGRMINRVNSRPIEEVAKISDEDRAYIRSKIKEDVSKLEALLSRQFGWLSSN